MRALVELQIAIPQFLVTCCILLFLLSKIRIWARGFLLKNVVFAFLLYLVYCASAVVFLTSLVLQYGTFLTENPALPLGLTALIFLGIPLMSNLLLMLLDRKLVRKQKMDKLQKFFNTTDSILLFLLVQPVVFTSFVLRDGPPDFASSSVIGALAFILTLVGIILYKIINLEKMMNEKRIWWIILAEWLLLVGVYLPSVSS